MTTTVRIAATKAAATFEGSISAGNVGNFITTSMITKDQPVYVEGKTGTTTGAHDGSSNVAVLVDSSEDWGIDQWVGYTLANTTDGSTTTVTSNTANTITGVLAGGTDDDWDAGDTYTLNGFERITFLGNDGVPRYATTARADKTIQLQGPIDFRIVKPETRNAVALSEYT